MIIGNILIKFFNSLNYNKNISFLININEIESCINSKQIFLFITLNNPNKINGIIIVNNFWIFYLPDDLLNYESSRWRVYAGRIVFESYFYLWVGENKWGRSMEDEGGYEDKDGCGV